MLKIIYTIALLITITKLYQSEKQLKNYKTLYADKLGVDFSKDLEINRLRNLKEVYISDLMNCNTKLFLKEQYPLNGKKALFHINAINQWANVQVEFEQLNRGASIFYHLQMVKDALE